MTDHKATKAVTTINKGPNELKKLLEDKGEKNLYNHLTGVCSHLVRHQAHDAMDKFEEVSYLMKKNNDKELATFMKTDIHKDYALPADAGMKSTSSLIINESKPHFKVSKDID